VKIPGSPKHDFYFLAFGFFISLVNFLNRDETKVEPLFLVNKKTK